MSKLCNYCSTEIRYERTPNNKFMAVEVDGGQPHRCPNRQTTWKVYPTGDSGSGKNTLEDMASKMKDNFGGGSGTPKKKQTLCRHCSSPIRFSSEVKSMNDRFIPLDMENDPETGDFKPHMCSQNPYYGKGGR